MELPIALPVTPMLAKAAKKIPAPGAVEGGYLYEPKWDGFRGIILRDGDEIEIASRGKKPLTRYFPELLTALKDQLPPRCAIDGEIVVRSGTSGAQRLDWEALSARIHPAASRIAKLADETPAEFVAFDLLAWGEESYLEEPFDRRRRGLEELFAAVAPGAVHLTEVTGDDALAHEWFDRFEGAGLDGVVAKARESTYQPGKRVMTKIKHARTAEAVLLGYRVHKSGQGVGSLLLGLYDQQGELVNVGGIAAFTNARRLELVDELAPLVIRDEDGQIAHAERERTRFSSAKDVSYVPLSPERVIEVAFDQLEGNRFRHAVQFLRWRPDRDPRSCTLDQVDRAISYDLAQVLRE